MQKICQMISQIPELVVVTGSASGLGMSVALELVGCGVAVIGVDITDTPKKMKSERYTHLKGDVASPELWQTVTDEIKARDPKRVGFICSAAVLRVGTLEQASVEDIALQMNVNFLGTALALRAAIPIMRQLGGGSIVAVASIDATFAEQQLAVYAASKGAVRQLTRTVAMDHAREGIRANVLSPGPMMAGLFERHMQSASDPTRFLATRAARQPGGRILDPSEIAQSAIFLLSDASSALNGAEIIADGGLTTSFDFRTGAEGASV